jgi:hypothetical protein
MREGKKESVPPGEGRQDKKEETFPLREERFHKNQETFHKNEETFHCRV